MTRRIREAIVGVSAAIVLVLGLPAGLILGLVVALAGPSLLQRLQPSAEERRDLQVASDLSLALELLGACLAGGAQLDPAVRAVAAAVPGPCGQRLLRVAGALAVGTTPTEAWAVLGTGAGPAGSAARALARAAEGGAPVAAAMVLVAREARAEAAAQATRAARRAGVLAVLPLGVCFLPAFVLLGVVPAIVGLAGPLLHGL